MVNIETTQQGNLLLGALFPDIRMSMSDSVIHRIIPSLDVVIQGFKPNSFERQGLQLLPPGLDQVQPAGVFGQLRI